MPSAGKVPFETDWLSSSVGTDRGPEIPTEDGHYIVTVIDNPHGYRSGVVEVKTHRNNGRPWMWAYRVKEQLNDNTHGNPLRFWTGCNWRGPLTLLKPVPLSTTPMQTDTIELSAPAPLDPVIAAARLLRIHAYWLVADSPARVDDGISAAAARLAMKLDEFWQPFAGMAEAEEKDWLDRMFCSRPENWQPSDSEAFIADNIVNQLARQTNAGPVIVTQSRF